MCRHRALHAREGPLGGNPDVMYSQGHRHHPRHKVKYQSVAPSVRVKDNARGFRRYE